MLSVGMLNVIMLSVIILSGMEPQIVGQFNLNYIEFSPDLKKSRAFQI